MRQLRPILRPRLMVDREIPDRFANQLLKGFEADGKSGTRKILKPAISGNASAASGTTRVNRAAVASPLVSRSTAAACPALNSTESVPATTNAVQTSTLNGAYLSSIATTLPARSATELIFG